MLTALSSGVSIFGKDVTVEDKSLKSIIGSRRYNSNTGAVNVKHLADSWRTRESAVSRRMSVNSGKMLNHSSPVAQITNVDI